MAYDCTAAQAELDALRASRLALLTGKRVVAGTYGDQSTTLAQVSVASLNDAIANLENEMLANGCTLANGRQAIARFAQPVLGDGRTR